MNSNWRAEDQEQWILANARVLWERHAEDNRHALVWFHGLILRRC